MVSLKPARLVPDVADPAPNVDTSLEQLLEYVAHGNQAAFAIVYDRVSAIVFGVAHLMLQDSHDATAVAQEALLDIWRTARQFEPSHGSAMAWITAIAHRQAVQRVREVPPGKWTPR